MVHLVNWYNYQLASTAGEDSRGLYVSGTWGWEVLTLGNRREARKNNPPISTGTTTSRSPCSSFY
jgi:hypothetical protein